MSLLADYADSAIAVAPGFLEKPNFAFTTSKPISVLFLSLADKVATWFLIAAAFCRSILCSLCSHESTYECFIDLKQILGAIYRFILTIRKESKKLRIPKQID